MLMLPLCRASQVACALLFVLCGLVALCAGTTPAVPNFKWTDHGDSPNVTVTSGQFSSVAFNGAVFIVYSLTDSVGNAQIFWSSASDGVSFPVGQPVNNSFTLAISNPTLTVDQTGKILYVLFTAPDDDLYTPGTLYHSWFLPTTQQWAPMTLVANSPTTVYQGFGSSNCRPDYSHAEGICFTWADQSSYGWISTLFPNSNAVPTLYFPAAGTSYAPAQVQYQDAISSGIATWTDPAALIFDEQIYTSGGSITSYFTQYLFQKGSGGQYNTEYYLTVPKLGWAAGTKWSPYSASSCGTTLSSGSGFSATQVSINGCQQSILITHLSPDTNQLIYFDFLFTPLNIWGGSYSLTLDSNRTIKGMPSATPEVVYLPTTGLVAVYYVDNSTRGSRLAIVTTQL